jgi:transcriptional regulator with XRE-family HTH domain
LDPGLAFGAVFRSVRNEAKLTQEEVALAATVDRTFVSLIERGQRQPTIRVLFKLAQAVNTTPSSLIALTEALVEAGG